MPITAYSQHFKRELDPDQLTALLKASPFAEGTSIDADMALRTWVSSDIQCSSCGRSGATIVRAGKSRQFQTHFRFRSENGSEVHHPFCEFYEADDGSPRGIENLIDFRKAKTQETRVVRELICKGIEQGIFDQSAIRQMRQWFFDFKVENRFHVPPTPEIVDFAVKVQRHPCYLLSRSIKFHPVHAEMPGFDWQAAAINKFTEDNPTLFSASRNFHYARGCEKRSRELIKKHQGQDVFNVGALKPYYDKAMTLSTFAAENSSVKFGKVKPSSYWHDGPPAALLALSALLLFIAKWDIDIAAGHYAHIFQSSGPNDSLLGNVIGLNPFHDYAAWHLVTLAMTIAELNHGETDYAALIEQSKRQLEDQYRRWKEDQGRARRKAD